MSLTSPTKDLSKLTRHEQDSEKSKLRHEQEELIDEMGQTSETKARSTVQKYVKEQREKERRKQEIALSKLDLLRKNRVNYQRFLVGLLYRFVKEEAIPRKYPIYVDSTDEGVACGIEGTEYMGAFRVCGIPFYDFNACKVLAVKIGNTVSRLEGNFNKTEGGILVGTKEELNLAIKEHGKNTHKS